MESAIRILSGARGTPASPAREARRDRFSGSRSTELNMLFNLLMQFASQAIHSEVADPEDAWHSLQIPLELPALHVRPFYETSYKALLLIPYYYTGPESCPHRARRGPG